MDAQGNPVAGAIVTAALGDDSTVTAQATTNAGGEYRIFNFPGRTVIVSATGPLGSLGSTASVAGTPFPDVVLMAFGTPVATPNNAFSQGTAGWINHNGADVSLIPHQEAPGPAAATSVTSYLLKYLPMSQAYAQAAPAQDYRAGTSGQGPRTVTYTFQPGPDAKSVRVRYRFQTEEFPTYFGSKYNDSFNLRLRTQSGGLAMVGGAMNELGQSAFDGAGSTAWKELTLQLPTPGEPIQVDLTVANVGDGIVDSSLIVDFVSTGSLAIVDAKLYDIDDTPLQFLSAASHTYFSSRTRVHATFKINGPEQAKLAELQLHVLQGGTVKARGALIPGLTSAVYKAFGASGIQLDTAQLAFEIPAEELETIDRSADGKLSLKLFAKADDGSTAEKDLGSLSLLDRFTGGDRYGQRDVNRGGDDWTSATLRDVAKAANVRWGDFSNMNAGSFQPDHNSHRQGKDVDGWYTGYNARDAAAANDMIALLDTPGVQSKVLIVYVSHKKADGDPFYDAYKDVTLADGRPARKVIQNFPGHVGHFHWHVQ